jgi:23S rRNA pseudouridine1911/1915/1917 synthase
MRVPPVGSGPARAESVPLRILFEDENVIVIDKPAGMVVHPAPGHSSGTLVNAILAHAPEISVGGVEQPGIVHRLDRDTSGLIVVAKNDAAMGALQAQWKSHSVRKVYLALVEGRVEPPSGRIEAPIARDPKHRQRMAVVTRGKTREATTVYRTLANLDRYTLLQCEPTTGRTHQIRVHLAFLGFPVVGDPIYSHRKNQFDLKRQFLHAWKLDLKLPDGRPAHFQAAIPPDLRGVLEQLQFDWQQLEVSQPALPVRGV